MQKRLISYALVAAASASAAIIDDVKEAAGRGDFTLAERQIQTYRAHSGVTPEMITALSWLGRAALAAKHYDQADHYARETHTLAIAELRKRPLDRDVFLPIALGAAIEVQASVLAASGERDAAVQYLKGELRTYHNTSIAARIQKNVNLLTLEGKPAPALGIGSWVGDKPHSLAELKGKPVLLFFWAHWCGDCKTEVPILARLQQEFGTRFTLVGPTQLYGYVANGEDAPPAAELKYIDDVRRKYYARLGSMSVPVSGDTFKNYGCSTTPTLVLVDRSGIVRMYHPGEMSYEELRARIERVLAT